VDPVRLLDTRSGSGVMEPGPIGPGEALWSWVPESVSYAGGVAIVANITGTQPTGDTYLTAWGDGARPLTSTLNLPPGLTAANLAMFRFGQALRSFDIYNNAGWTHVIADLNGYFY